MALNIEKQYQKAVRIKHNKRSVSYKHPGQLLLHYMFYVCVILISIRFGIKHHHQILSLREEESKLVFICKYATSQVCQELLWFRFCIGIK